MVERLGHRKIIARSDKEPAILALKKAVRRVGDVEIVLEEASVGDREANGLVENAIKNAQVQFRMIKDALESMPGNFRAPDLVCKSPRPSLRDSL